MSIGTHIMNSAWVTVGVVEARTKAETPSNAEVILGLINTSSIR